MDSGTPDWLIGSNFEVVRPRSGCGLLENAGVVCSRSVHGLVKKWMWFI